VNHWTNHGPGPNGSRIAYCICGWTQQVPTPQAAHEANLDHREIPANDQQH
jgi:hypothetical protein